MSRLNFFKPGFGVRKHLSPLGGRSAMPPDTWSEPQDMPFCGSLHRSFLGLGHVFGLKNVKLF